MIETAVIFPGQGSQAVGMLADLAAAHDIVRKTFDEASGALDRDLWALVSDGPETDLNQTQWTQPAMLTGDIAVWRVWRAGGGPMPTAMAGHSLGEYAALVAAGAMAFADAVRIVHLRGRLMQQAVAEGEGAMAAILGLDDAVVEDICRGLPAGRVVPANYNSPGQLVIAGARAEVAQAVERCREAGARRAMLLPVSVPAHSPMMASAETGLDEALAGIDLRRPECPVLHNADLEEHDDPVEIRAALVRQLTRPVPWTGTIRALIERGCGRFLECGPGKVLTGLGRRIERSADWSALEAPDALAGALAD